MSVGDSTQISDDEILFRRIPVSQGWYSQGVLSPEAYRPRYHDEDGISFWRAKYRNLQAVAHGPSPRGYWVALLRVGDLRTHGIECVPTESVEGAGHVSIPSLNHADRKKPLVEEMKVLLATQLTVNVEGPFHGPEPTSV